jgi:RNA polymerase sigma-70 factor (ECF subfamily)
LISSCPPLERPAETVYKTRVASALTPTVEERVAAAWPKLKLDGPAFAAFLDEKREAAGPDQAALAVEDLYLAFGCSRGDRAALDAFEREMKRDLEAAFARMRIPPARRDDARQQIWEKLFVGPPRPRILDYSGRGRLRFWFRVTALRTLLDELRSDHRRVEVLDEDLVLGAASSAADPELEHLKRVYRNEVGAAFEESVRALSPEDRNVLRSYYGRSMTIDEIAAAFGIHRATAARRVNGARERLLGETRRRITEKLSLKSRELDSVFRLIESRLHLSVGRLLGP